MTQIFLLTTNGSDATWPDPGNWNAANNTVEAIGAGSTGLSGNTSTGYSGGGSGGGAYAKGTNLTLTFPVTYNIGGNGFWSTNQAVNFNRAGTSYTNVNPGPNIVSATMGTSGSASIAGAGGSATNCWPTGFSGGNGGNGSSVNMQSPGGGGAAGPHGSGGAAANVTTAAATPGGASDAGTVAGGAVNTIGSSGTQWDATHGTGSGGGGTSAATTAAGAGGAYGGGGAGGFGGTGVGKNGGAGGPGLIVITYTPPPTKTTWNPADKGASIVLDATNLIATLNGGNQGVRTVDRVYSGLYYWELTFTTTQNASIGVCPVWANFATLASGTATQNGVLCTNAGNIFGPTNLGLSTGGTVTNGWVCCVALDATRGWVWFRNGAAGNWNGQAAANPATGANGVSVTPAFTFVPGYTGIHCYAQGGGGGGVVTANFGDSAFVGTPPAGFAAGFPAGTTVGPVAALDTQTLVEQWTGGTPTAQLTQVMVEQWATPNFSPPQVAMTQILIEQWARTPLTPPGGASTQARAIILA